MSEDLAHDAHLRAALRHAPDHALSPPSGLSQTILAAARQVHRPARATPAPSPMGRRAAPTQRLRAWLRRLFAPRWAGAWAAGLVAALGLGLWLDLGLQPTIERPAAVATGGAQPEAAAPAEVARGPTSQNGSVAGDARVAELSKAATPAPARRGEVGAGVAQQRAAVDASRDLAALQDSTAPQPATPPALAVAPEASQPAHQMAAPAAKAAAQSPAPLADAHAGEPSARNAAGLRAAPGEAHKAEVGDAAPAASPALTLLRRAQAELAAGSATWTWAAPGRAAAMAPFDDAAQAWLRRVVQGARGRWLDVSERGESLAALEVRWWRDGWPHATLRIEPDGLRWIEPGGRIRYAPLDPATLQRLRSF